MDPFKIRVFLNITNHIHGIRACSQIFKFQVSSVTRAERDDERMTTRARGRGDDGAEPSFLHALEGKLSLRIQVLVRRSRYIKILQTRNL